MTRELVLLGGGGHGGSVLEVVRALGSHRPVGVLDPALPAGSEAWGLAVLGGDDLLPGLVARGVEAFLGLGAVRPSLHRRRLFERAAAAGARFPVLVHPAASVAPDARLGEGTVVMPGAIVRTGAVVGRNVIVNTAAVVEHHCRVGDHVHLATGARLCGAVTVGDDALVGAGAVVLQERTVGRLALVAAAAMVHRDVPAGGAAAGNPAKALKGLLGHGR